MVGPVSDSMYRELLQKKYDIMQQRLIQIELSRWRRFLT